MSGQERERLRALYREDADYWPQADELAASLGLRREDVLGGEDLARRMDALLQGMSDGAVAAEDAWWRTSQMWQEGPAKCAAFSPAASRLLLSEAQRREPLVVAITGEVVGPDPSLAGFEVRGLLSLGGRFQEALALAAAALREEGHSPGLVARIEARLAEGGLPSLGENLARVVGDDGIRDAATRGDIPGLLAALEERPAALQDPLALLRAAGEQHRLKPWVHAQLREELRRVRQRAWRAPWVRPHLELAKALLDLSVPWTLRGADAYERVQAALRVLDAERQPRAQALASRLLEVAPAAELPRRDLDALRGLVYALAAERTWELPPEPYARAVSTLLSSVQLYAAGDAPRALALASEIRLFDPDHAERRRRALLELVRGALRDHLGPPLDER